MVERETPYASRYRKLDQAELVADAKERFGEDPEGWQFICPACGDVTKAQDFRDAGADPNRLGQECIGRSTKERGCNWAAYGLFRGPWIVTFPDGKEVPGFALAEAV